MAKKKRTFDLLTLLNTFIRTVGRQASGIAENVGVVEWLARKGWSLDRLPGGKNIGNLLFSFFGEVADEVPNSTIRAALNSAVKAVDKVFDQVDRKLKGKEPARRDDRRTQRGRTEREAPTPTRVAEAEAPTPGLREAIETIVGKWLGKIYTLTGENADTAQENFNRVISRLKEEQIIKVAVLQQGWSYFSLKRFWSKCTSQSQLMRKMGLSKEEVIEPQLFRTILFRYPEQREEVAEAKEADPMKTLDIILRLQKAEVSQSILLLIGSFEKDSDRKRVLSFMSDWKEEDFERFHNLSVEHKETLLGIFRSKKAGLSSSFGKDLLDRIETWGGKGWNKLVALDEKRKKIRKRSQKRAEEWVAAGDNFLKGTPFESLSLGKQGKNQNLP